MTGNTKDEAQMLVEDGVDARSIQERLAKAEHEARSGRKDNLDVLLPRIIVELGHDLQGLLPIASALESRADFSGADAIYHIVTSAMPDCYPAFEAFAMSAFHRRDWPETVSRWRSIQRRFPERSRPAIWLAGALQASRQYDEAERVLREAAERFPNDTEIARDWARLPLAQGNLEEGLTRLAVLRERFPRSIDGFTSGAETLQRLGRFEEAEALLESVRSVFEGGFFYDIQSAWNATRLGLWSEAFRRWDAVISRHADFHGTNTAVGDAITLWHLAKTEGDLAAVQAVLPVEIARRAGVLTSEGNPRTAPILTDHDLLMAFEGLGDRCEFGLVQRHFGAEPIGLLRWSGIEPKDLVAVLESRFDGVGEPENTFIRAAPPSDEYFAGDNRFFYMHTFIKKMEGDEQVLFEKFRKRLNYLKDKLLSDLGAGEKIFMYKAHHGELAEADAYTISDVLARRFPASRVVLTRVASDPSQVGTISPLAANAVWAFLSRFSGDLDSRFIRYDEWRSVCLAAVQHFAPNRQLTP